MCPVAEMVSRYDQPHRNLRRAVRSARLIVEKGAFGQRFSGAVRLHLAMTKNIALSRPAMSAIAAFLVLSTPALAQEAPAVTMTPPVAAPTPQTPPTVPEPNTTAPVAAPQTAETPAPKPVIHVPLDIAPAETASAPQTAEKAAAPVRTERSAPRSNPKTAPAVATAAPAAAAPAAESAVPEEVAPAAAPVMVPAEPVAEATPLPAEKATAGGDFPWELAGGAAALLIVGGMGLAFARRRRIERVEYVEEAYEPVASTEPVAVEPATASTASDAPAWVTPAYVPRERAQAPRTSPSFAAAPSGSMGRHEAMAMAGPTPDNPFATLSKRLKRARFLDRQERVVYEETLGARKDMTRRPVSAWEIAQREVAPAPAEQEVRRPERGPARPGTLRPGFSRH